MLYDNWKLGGDITILPTKIELYISPVINSPMSKIVNVI